MLDSWNRLVVFIAFFMGCCRIWIVRDDGDAGIVSGWYQNFKDKERMKA